MKGKGKASKQHNFGKEVCNKNIAPKGPVGMGVHCVLDCISKYFVFFFDPRVFLFVSFFSFVMTIVAKLI